MKQKKGQVTYFVIVGILILAASGIFIYSYNMKKLGSDMPGETSTLLGKPEDLNAYMQSCLQDSADEGLIVVGIMGGRYPLRENYYAGQGFKSAVYYNKGYTEVPTTQDIQDSLALYISENINYVCIPEAKKVLGQEGYNIKIEEITPASITVSAGQQTTFKARIPITATKNEKVITTSDFYYESPVNFEKLNEMYVLMTAWTVEDPKYIPVSKLLDMEGRYDMDITPYRDADNAVVTYEIEDRNSKVEGEKYQYWFTVRV